jgi:DNA polymerase
MLVGEQPGDVEDREGEPFVGPAGRVLDQAFKDAGIGRDDVYLTNAVKHFRHQQRGKRRIHQKPAVSHIVACHPWLEAELDLIRPHVLVALGSVAGRAVMGRPVKIAEERGRLLEPGERGLAGASSFLLTAHPSSILRLRQLDDPKPARAAMDDLVADLSFAAGIPAAAGR